MALSKGLRLLSRLDPMGPGSVLLEARGRDDCLLFEAGTVATLGECRAPPRCSPRRRRCRGGRELVSETSFTSGDLGTSGAWFTDGAGHGDLGTAKGACPRECVVRRIPESWHSCLGKMSRFPGVSGRVFLESQLALVRS